VPIFFLSPVSLPTRAPGALWTFRAGQVLARISGKDFCAGGIFVKGPTPAAPYRVGANPLADCLKVVLHKRPFVAQHLWGSAYKNPNTE
jgi:hypothetical protein